jgi:hypothetical protein
MDKQRGPSAHRDCRDDADERPHENEKDERASRRHEDR